MPASIAGTRDVYTLLYGAGYWTRTNDLLLMELEVRLELTTYPKDLGSDPQAIPFLPL